MACASVSPVSSEKEEPQIFPSVENIVPGWQPFAAGVSFFHGETENPKLEFWALRVDLASPDVRVIVKGGAENRGRANHETLSVKVPSFVRDNNLIAGINAVPFDIASSREGRPVMNAGLVIAGGEVIAAANPRYDAIVFYKDSYKEKDAVKIISQSAINETDNIENAAGAFHHILVKGEPAQRTLNRESRYQRSAAGISQDNRYLYLAVIDSACAVTQRKRGSTEKETALLLRSLGCWDALNLDGGGSSALALRYPDGKIRLANTPSHNGIPGRERAVAGCIGVFSLSMEK
jgi:exopolysaccharide biosynthesis protein